MIVGAGIIIHNGKAYIPTQGQLDDGPYVDIEPIYEEKLQVDEIVFALEKVISAGHPRYPTPTKEQWQNREDPMLKATGFRNWKALAKSAASYSIYWGEEGITLYFSKLDSKGRFGTDNNKTVSFPIDVPLDKIIEIILDDVRNRPEKVDPR